MWVKGQHFLRGEGKVRKQLTGQRPPNSTRTACLPSYGWPFATAVKTSQPITRFLAPGWSGPLTVVFHLSVLVCGNVGTHASVYTLEISSLGCQSLPSISLESLSVPYFQGSVHLTTRVALQKHPTSTWVLDLNSGPHTHGANSAGHPVYLNPMPTQAQYQQQLRSGFLHLRHH